MAAGDRSETRIRTARAVSWQSQRRDFELAEPQPDRPVLLWNARPHERHTGFSGCAARGPARARFYAYGRRWETGVAFRIAQDAQSRLADFLPRLLVTILQL